MKELAAVVTLLALVAACSQPPSAGRQTTATASSARAQTTTQVPQAANEAPPTQNGVYIQHEICPGEGGCPWKHWRAAAPIELRAREDATSPIVGTLQPGEWVEALGGEVRLIPRRGVVQRDKQNLKAGDVVYSIGAEGEGFVTLWRRGETLSWSSDDDDAIQWGEEGAAASDGSTLGWWVQVKRESDGLTGWVPEPRDFECMGPLGGDDGCRG